MINVFKDNNFNGTDIIKINTDNGFFYVFLDKNLNLCFKCKSDIVNSANSRSFIISDDNYFLYKTFSKVYDSILYEMSFNHDYERQSYDNSLVNNGIIEWHSDADDFDFACILLIEKIKDAFLVTLGMPDDYHPVVVNYSVCIDGNDSSRYYPYNKLFFEMYDELCNHDFEYEQITMDEYINRIKVRTR